MSKKILVVDDEPDVVKYLETFLTKEGYEVLTASDGYEAQKVVEKNRPDLISLDIQMPKETGVKFYRKLKKDDALKEIPIIVVSGLSGRHLAVPHPDAIFEKPVDLDRFGKTIKELIS